jgi:hypothetical protein
MAAGMPAFRPSRLILLRESSPNPAIQQEQCDLPIRTGPLAAQNCQTGQGPVVQIGKNWPQQIWPFFGQSAVVRQPQVPVEVQMPLQHWALLVHV